MLTIRLKKIIYIVLVSLNTLAHAKLSQDDILRLYSEHGPAWDNPYFASFRDGVDSGVDQMLGLLGKRLSPLKIANEGFRKGELTVSYSLYAKTVYDQSCKGGVCFQPQPLRAPLVVFFPGLTQGINHPHAEWIRSIANRNGAHALVIPAAFSPDYLAANPKDPTATYEAEARIAYELLQRARKQIGEDLISEVQFVGLSYGAFLGPMVASHGVPKLRKMTLLSLPISMKAIIHALDDAMNANLTPYPWDYGIPGAVWWSKVGYSSDDQTRLAEAKRYLAWSFQDGQVLNAVDLGVRFGCAWPTMNAALNAFPLMAQLPINPDGFPTDQPLYRKFAEEVRFWNTIENCTPQNLPFYKSEKDGSPFWLAQLNKSIDVDVVVTHDDPFISAEKWKTVAPGLRNIRYIELPHGGHNGYMYTDWLKLYLSDRIH